MSLLSGPIVRIPLVRLPVLPSAGRLSYALPAEVSRNLGLGFGDAVHMVSVGSRTPLAVCQRATHSPEELVCTSVDYPL